ncbi:phenoloxidase-activating factor 2-like [Drosophila takahashii]|uniref:phenoloxidase-activating factor 2-like n=1 Tax=Drosophila takahashii TaxID=29030 RepID=UPI001CF91F20|nr:phenoloxidase-activating factor 2-like [Drosophila takahashii]
MERFWTFGALFLGSLVLFGDACLYHCLSREHCDEQAPILNFNQPYYRTNRCRPSEVCCKTPRQNNPVRCDLYPENNHPNIAPTINPSKPYYPTNYGAENQPCGKSNPNEEMEWYHFNNLTTPGEYPWVVALFKNGKFLAGGSLIAPGVVLTAAHLVKYETKDKIIVRAGEWDLNSNREGFQFEEREVEKIVWHERFDFQTGANNIALLFLKSKFQLKNHIRTICLPSPTTSFEGHRCIVAGWGKTYPTDPSHSTILKRVTLPIIKRSTCEQQLRRTNLGWSYQLPESLICAGGELNQDACIGDGGSALFCSIGARNSDVYMQVGIVNWGIDCGKENVPATYTDVAMFREWIEKNLLDFNYNYYN